MVKNLTMVDSQEGIRSFMEKRKPVWTHSSEKCHQIVQLGPWQINDNIWDHGLKILGTSVFDCIFLHCTCLQHHNMIKLQESAKEYVSFTV